MRLSIIKILFTSLFLIALHYLVLAVDVMPRPVTVCSGASVIIKGDLLGPTPNSFSWEFYQGASWVSAPGVNSDQNYLVSSLYNPSTVNIAYSLRRKVVIAGVVDYDSYYFVTVQPILPVTNNLITAPKVNTFCAPGEPAQILGSLPLSGTSTFLYQWQSSTDNINFTSIDGATSKDYTPGKLSSTIYLRRISIPDGCGLVSISNTIQFTVFPQVTNNQINPPSVAQLCSKGDPAVITGEIPAGGNGVYTYKWQQSSDNVLFTDIAGATDATYDPPALTETTYFRRSAVSGLCNLPVLSNVVTIHVLPQLVVPEFEQAIANICAGRSITLSVKNPLSGISYYWYDSPERTNLLFVGPTYTTGILQENKTYYVASSNGTCSSTSMGIMRVIVSALPGATLLANNGKASACSGSTAVFHVTSPNPDFSYIWYAAPTGGISIGSGSAWTTPAVTQTTTFYLETVNKEGCASSVRQAVEVTVMPILGSPQVTIESTTQYSITFRWNAVPGAEGYKISIDNGLTYIAPSSGSSGLTHTVDGLHGSQSVTILVKAVGSLDCQEGPPSTGVTGETVKEFDDLFVPNAFTPNGDGRNDIVYVRSQTVKSLRFLIYSQWGEQVFNGNSISVGWDGTHKGNSQPVGVYVYTVKATMNDGREISKKGTITLIR